MFLRKIIPKLLLLPLLIWSTVSRDENSVEDGVLFTVQSYKSAKPENLVKFTPLTW